MGKGPVTSPGRASNAAPTKPPSWKLKPPHDTVIQGIVISGFSSLPSALALFLFCDWPEHGPGHKTAGNGGWLKDLDAVAPITDADERDKRAASVAFTYTGLQKIGLDADALATFSQPFREGMYQEDRLRRLGDKFREEWQGTVIPGGPRWSGNIPSRRWDVEVSKLSRERTLTDVGSPLKKGEDESKTPITVHALVVLYEETPEAAVVWAQQVERQLARHGVRVAHRLPLELRLDAKDISREHFGFADGISQPIPYEEKEDLTSPDVLIMSDGSPVVRDDWHGVPLGEILIGHTNAHHEKAPGPFVADNRMARDCGLTTNGAPEGLRNFGLNGSYLVVRELQQHVGAFWKSLEDNAEWIRAHDPGATHVTAEWLADRVIGRNTDGHLLCPSGFLKSDQYDTPQNAIGFKMTDPESLGCPAGSRVRRANPRDGLAKGLASAKTSLDAANNHRILRRGRKYGTPIAKGVGEDGAERGLLFMCLNTDIARQFEFVQQTWLLNKNFATLFDETDPLIGPEGGFTIREQPLRRIVQVKTFIQMAGGEYFFLPSIPAFNYLAAL
jgi:deferrochelatase/peroxidase EfeB